ncbi:hypothetical protein G647_01230 [Cladophialophora carrionii CBS 160.54]|uniref:Telomerase reverse transcriptase n=1 Tax=Cladophialophora carrionii CBS 160.54 TaxID=1279043 RepID=V9DPF4_9EURO|nr:uncharacterized protein G647_01230 [Cladophialophora carrionii CBS 160.54]ETI28779.1 hypothetical protein G647_01230 [Cladophialophora carrionii CBS 160.54]
MARKRKCPETTSNRAQKRAKSANRDQNGVRERSPYLHHSVLSSFYPQVCTLRNYLLAGLPTSSRVRRRKLTGFGKDEATSILDTCLVGLLTQPSISVRESRRIEFATFTQTQARATGANTGRAQPCCIDEVIDFVIWSLFRGDLTKRGRPSHILCHGLQRGAVHEDRRGAAPTSLPGIIRRHPNDNLTALKTAPWSDILPLLGADAEVIFSSLLLDCGIFTRIESGKDNYFQLSGIPLSDLPELKPARAERAPPSNAGKEHVLSVNSISFARHRMLYARPSFSAAGKVKFGLHHTHVLQRLADDTDQRQAVHLLKYIFPRQFGLHNVFRSKARADETTQKYIDYTFREQEITSQRKRSPSWTPRRLRGETIRLVRKIHRNHKACSYSQLLRHYCPLISSQCQGQAAQPGRADLSLPSSDPLVTQHLLSGTSKARADTPIKGHDSDTSFLPHATPAARVSAFCRAVVSSLLPRNAFGSGLDGQENRKMILNKVDDFVQMRRFESMTLHQVLQGFRITSITWLFNPGNLKGKMSKSDYSKRCELLQELMYYVFDSLLIPIIRAHFYVTESSTHRNRLLYFRQDVWRKLSEPSLATLRLKMYSLMTPSNARHQLQSRSLGYSQLRLLPKDQGARPITNLKRKQSKAGPGQRVVGQSINNQLAPIFSILNYERARDPWRLGSALFSVGDIHGRVAEFKRTVPPGSRLFFAKVDVESCFDTIPQDHLLRLVEDLLSEPSYRTTKHIEVKSLDRGYQGHAEGLKRKWAGIARPAHEQAVFSETSVAGLAAKKRQVIFCGLGQQRVWSRQSVLKLLQDHISDSMVKMGKRYAKQIDGIPQGSVLSSLLCNYFYGAFERNELGFLHPQSCLLLRLIDDFLLVTTNDKLARRFLEVMANGDQGYGIQVNPEKSLVNFDVTVKGRKVPRVPGEAAFPYCGMAINVRTLEMKKDREKKDERVSNSLTVESCSRPGVVLKRKIMASLKNQMHAMLLDLSLNSRAQVISTLVGNFTEAAMKMHQYLVGMAARNRPPPELVRGLVQDLVVAGCKICRAKNSLNGQVQHITQAQMCWIAAVAFEGVLTRKQTQYQDLLAWLKALREYAQPRMNMEQAVLEQLLQDNNKAFQTYVY